MRLLRESSVGLLVVLGAAGCGGDAKEPDYALDGSYVLGDAGSGGQDGGFTYDGGGYDAAPWFDASSGDATTGDGSSDEGSTDGSLNDGSLNDGAAADGALTDAGDAGIPTGDGFEGSGSPWLATAPRASCAAGGKPDGTLGGLNGDFRCNLTVQGEVAAPHFLSLAWYKDCAYVNGADGTTVIQVAADGKPTVVTTLTQVGFKSNWESMKASEKSGLIAGYESNGAMLTVYDLSADCKAPVLQSSTRLGGALGSLGHAGSFSPDGTIYYGSSMFTSAIFAVDLTTPKTPKVITTDFPTAAHDLFIGKNGTRGYMASPDVAALGVGSLAIVDLTQVQSRAANAKGVLIKSIKWEDGNVSQYPIPLTYKGRDYLMITDELGSGNCDDPKKPQWGYARIFDISNEQNPVLVSLIKTEAQDPKNCMAASTANGGTSGFGLGTHYCNVDRQTDPRVLMCGNWDAGLRVYDIRNPWRPKEIAYFDTPSANMPGLARLIPEKREIWLAVTPGTFYVLKISPGTPLDQLLGG